MTHVEITTWLTASSVVINLALLGFILNLSNKFSEVQKARLEQLKEFSEQRHTLTEREHSINLREKEFLHLEIEKEVKQLRSLLENSGFRIDQLQLGIVSVPENAPKLLKGATESAASLKRAESVVSEEGLSPDPESYLIVGKAFAAAGRWLDAAHQLEQYRRYHPEDFDANYARAVSYANARNDDKNALRAYSDVISSMPQSLPSNFRARLFVYRGAILKRLGRLEEAEADLLLAKRFNPVGLESIDLDYNLACIYAMTSRRSELLSVVKEVVKFPQYRSAIRSHMGDYFLSYANDADFLSLIRS